MWDLRIAQVGKDLWRSLVFLLLKAGPDRGDSQTLTGHRLSMPQDNLWDGFAFYLFPCLFMLHRPSRRPVLKIVKPHSFELSEDEKNMPHTSPYHLLSDMAERSQKCQCYLVLEYENKLL